jgi:hypothetical protein
MPEMKTPPRIAKDIARGIASGAARGAAFALVAAAISYAVAIWGFGRDYYIGVLIPFALVLFLLVAWLTHLRRQGFMADYRREEDSSQAASHNAPATPPSSIFAPRDDVIVPRSDIPPRKARSAPEKAESSREAIRALLWGALWLGLLAAWLYRFAGIGASYYSR